MSGMITPTESESEWKKTLSKVQYYVTREGGTERPFSGIYNEENREGIYRCVCCDHILFTSEMKYNSGCGWPAFHSEHPDAGITKVRDFSHNMIRIEAKCSNCDAHLGHIFDDGPKDTGGKRYCINSASLNFNTAVQT